MSTAAVDTLLYLLDESFSGDEEHSLITNVDSVELSSWRERYGESGRTIADIAAHAATALWVYREHAFGAGTVGWDEAEAHMRAEMTTLDDARSWLERHYASFRACVAELNDVDLDAFRQNHWGEPRPARRIISVIIQHNLYHAGEINHLRALLQGDDRWPGEA